MVNRMYVYNEVLRELNKVTCRVSQQGPITGGELSAWNGAARWLADR